jgi:putative sigma-54 modulation protein
VQIKISARHGHLNEEIQAHIRDKAGKLLHIFQRIMMIDVLVDHQHDDSFVEFRVSAEHKHDFVASERNKDLLAAVDLVLAKLEGQLRKYKEKVQDHHRGTTKGEATAPRDVEADTDADADA